MKNLLIIAFCLTRTTCFSQYVSLPLIIYEMGDIYNIGRDDVVKAKLENEGFKMTKSEPDYELNGTKYKAIYTFYYKDYPYGEDRDHSREVELSFGTKIMGNHIKRDITVSYQEHRDVKTYRRFSSLGRSVTDTYFLFKKGALKREFSGDSILSASYYNIKSVKEFKEYIQDTSTVWLYKDKDGLSGVHPFFYNIDSYTDEQQDRFFLIITINSPLKPIDFTAKPKKGHK